MGTSLARRMAGPLWLTGAAVSFTVMAALVKHIGLPAFEKAFWRSAVAAVAILLFMVFAHRELRDRYGSRFTPFSGRRLGLLALRGVVGCAALSLYFLAIDWLPFGDAVTLQQSNPLFVALWAPFLIRERVRSFTIGLMLLAFIGVVLIAGPTGEGSASGIAVALGSAVCSSVAYIAVRDLRRTEHPYTIVWTFSAISVLSLGAAYAAGLGQASSLFAWQWPDGADWLPLLATGLSATLGQICLTRGIALTPAATAATLVQSQIALSLLLQWLVWQSPPGAASLAGAALITAGTIGLAAAHERKEAAGTCPRPVPTPPAAA